MGNSGFTTYNEIFDYEADDTEAVVYLISPSSRLRCTSLYVMKRHEAVKFCSRPETSYSSGFMHWAYCFTTHKRDWRYHPDHFRKDDGRFDKLLEELEIIPIYRGGDKIPVETETYEEYKARVLDGYTPQQVRLEGEKSPFENQQLCLFD